MQRAETRPRAVKIALAFAIVVLTAAGMTVPAHAQTFRVLYEFTGATDGGYPFTGLARDPSGNLYGTTPLGGLPESCVGNGCGVVFKVDGDGKQTVLYSFDFIEPGWEEPGWDGAHPYGTLVRDAQGNLYGTTWLGGRGPCHFFPESPDFRSACGTVFKLDRDGKETVLYNFVGGPSDGVGVPDGVVRDERGNLYGVTSWGGSWGFGVVFKVDKDGHETVLHSFSGGSDGAYPDAGLIRDKQGNLYGTTQYGGSHDAGTVFKLDTDGQESVLYSFTGGADGAHPSAVPLRDEDGNLYGTTVYGGSGNCYDGIAYGCGTVFKLDGEGRETVLYTFTGGADGAYPQAGLIRGKRGNLYGTASQGGSSNVGTVFMLDRRGRQTVLHTFTGGSDGAYPFADLLSDEGGNLYGTAVGGGRFYAGTVFKLTPE
jgi:uncharacterized repeat protein (TIGR03803 family)